MTAASRANLPALTGVRGLAALWVLGYHLQFFARAFGVDWLKDPPILRSGWVGVDLFFVLSGFVLMHAHQQDFVRPTFRATGRFAILRVFRVYPLATVVLLLLAALLATDPHFSDWYRKSHDPLDLTWISFVRTLTLSTRWFPPFTGDWNQPTWSLSAEIVGYAAFPLLAMLAARLNNGFVAMLLAIAALALPQLLQPILHAGIGNDIFGFALVRMAGGFAAGIVLYRLHRLTPDRYRWLQGWSADLALVALIVALFTPLRLTAPLFCFGLLVYGLAGKGGVTQRLLASRPALWLGRISFPLYLIHTMTLFFLYYELAVHNVPIPWRVAVWGAFAPAAMLVAWGLHLVVERPSHEFGRRLARRWG